MRQSESIEKLAPALVAAQAEIGGAVKGAENPFFKSKYADLNSVILAMKPIFVKNKFALVQLPCSDENGVGVITRLQHASGEFIEQQFTLPLAKSDPQAAGSAITYAKRYALKALGLMPDLDDDGEAAMFRQVDEFTAEQKARYIKIMAEGDGFGMKAFGTEVGNEVMTALFNDAPPKQKTKQKAMCAKLVSEANTFMKAWVANVESLIANGSASDSITETWEELTSTEQHFCYAAMDEVTLLNFNEMTGITL